MTLKQVWDLESIFPGGSESKEYVAYLESLAADIEKVYQQVAGDGASSAEGWVTLLNEVQDVSKRMRQAMAFIGCLSAQNVKDDKAKILAGKARKIGAAMASALTHLDKHILNMPDDQWSGMIAAPELSELKFNLEERRRRAKEKMSADLETLVNNLSTDGYQGWSNLYDTVVGRMTIEAEENGKPVSLSPGQAANKLLSPDRSFREHLWEKWEEAWAKDADYCALALNNLAGFRLSLYGQRGWDDVHREPLDYNRMLPDTLNAMWSAIDNSKDRLVKFLNRKKEILGVEKLTWHDVNAPIGTSESKMSFDEAADFIVEQLGRFSPDMASFTQAAFDKNWVEAEDRPGKRPGAFCTSFPEKRESRVFMTFSGTMGNVSTLAHELGHAYHQSVMNDLPPMAQQYAMNVAETASTFNEVTVSDAAVRFAKTPEEKVVLIEDKLQRAVQLLMNIQCRFIFETNFYNERKKGLVSKQRLNELMVEAQKQAYADALDEYHPHFWASKLHFYNTGVPFYNFPYTFGYLFATGVYARAKKEGAAFAPKYDDLLRDTGRMRVEDLAQLHMGVDLTKPEFWQDAIDSSLAELDEFMALTEK